MPMPSFKGSSSKNDTPKSTSIANLPRNDEGPTPGDTIPAYSDSFEEAWATAYKELPQARGAEKILNKIGQSIIFQYPASPGQCSLWVYRKGMSRIN